jgi:ankyrin repeat protein
MYAVWNGHTAAVRILLEKKAVANVENSEGETALVMAAQQENMEIVQLLSRAGGQGGSN